MSNSFLDYNTGSFVHTASDHTAIDSDGHLLTRMGDNLALDTTSGEMHIISSWKKNEEDEDSF